MVTKMRRSMYIAAFAVIVCLLATALSLSFSRSAYAADATTITEQDFTLTGGSGTKGNEYTFAPNSNPEVSSSLVKGTDYTVEYQNGGNVTKEAFVVIKGIGTYSGEVKLPYVIKADTSRTYSVKWQYLQDGVWTEITKKELFTYGKDYSAFVRAELTIDGYADYVEYVYAQEVTPSDKAGWNPNMYIMFSGTFDGKTVYELKNATTYMATLQGEGNVTVPVGRNAEITVSKAKNDWDTVPFATPWYYLSYDRTINLIGATPLYLDDPSDLWFKITSDKDGNQEITGLTKFGLAEDGYVSNVAMQKLSSLPVGTYYLFAGVDGNGNYDEITLRSGTPFKVLQAGNHWETSPGIKTWIEGSFTEDNLPFAEPLHGKDNVNIVIYAKDDADNVVYDKVKGINKLSEAPVGTYVMTASVGDDAEGNFAGIADTTVEFDIYKKAGLPWWAVLVLIVGALGIAALLIFVLFKAGIFKLLTRKASLSIRTRATVDATIAAVRANKVAQEAKRSVALAKARDKEEQRKAEEEAFSALPDAEKAAILAERAKAEEERIAKVKARAAEMQARADSLKKEAQALQKSKTKNSTDD